MILYDYLRGFPLDPLELSWAGENGTLLDLDGAEFKLDVGALLGGFSWVTKTAGVAGSNGDPNVTITFGPDELAAIPDGTWVCRLTATGGALDGPQVITFMMRATSMELGASTRPVGTWPAHMPCDLGGGDETWAARNVALVVATSIMWALSGRRFGWATTTIRPARRRAGCAIPDGWWLSRASSTPWPAGPFDAFPWGRFWAWDPRENLAGKVLRLPRRPVVAVHEVMVDGEVLPPSAYRVDRHGELVRLDGGTWPDTNDVLAEDDDDGAFAVTWTYGRNVPPAGLIAVGVYACELAKLLCGQECQLPARVKEFSHGGANVAMLDPQDFLDRGHTGIYLCDQFLAAYNPNRLARAPRVYRADARPGHRRTRT